MKMLLSLIVFACIIVAVGGAVFLAVGAFASWAERHHNRKYQGYPKPQSKKQ